MWLERQRLEVIAPVYAKPSHGMHRSPAKLSITPPPLSVKRKIVLCPRNMAFNPPALTVAEDAQEIGDQGVDIRPQPYQDWEQEFTEDGGYRIAYKDIDDRLLIKIARWAGWALSLLCAIHAINASGLFNAAGPWFTAVLLSGVALYVLFRGPTYLRRTIEIAPDCIIVDGQHVLWAEFMELGPPTLKWDEKREKATIGVAYGNRWVEIGTTHRLDEFDRTPELLEAKLQWAFGQLWYRGQSKRDSTPTR